ncbi:MAG TPA: V-type ATP synthase subunit D [Gemmatimonadales bacterium]|nr:V-type ATP synthase subunit D [Gemmatimonadales bacterium]
MSAVSLAPTRLNLVRAVRRLERLSRGAAVLRRKREALVTELFRLARPAADAREQIAAAAQRAYPLLGSALALQGQAGVRATGWPGRDLAVEVSAGSVWGVVVSRIESRPAIARTLGARGTAPAGTGPAAVQAATEFEKLAELLLDAAPREMLLRRLGQALAQTSRQVHSLEHRLSPRLQGDIARVRQVLDEREREERLRLQTLARSSRHRAFTIPSSSPRQYDYVSTEPR